MRDNTDETFKKHAQSAFYLVNNLQQAIPPVFRIRMAFRMKFN